MIAKILPIVNVALAAIAMIVSIVVLLQVMGIKSSLESPVLTEEEMIEETAIIPFAQLEEYNLEDGFILSPTSVENPEAKINVVLKVGFALDTLNEGFDDAKTILTGKNQLIGSKIQDVLVTKDVSYFKDDVKSAELKQEILLLVQSLIGNDAITEVYFIKPIVNEK